MKYPPVYNNDLHHVLHDYMALCIISGNDFGAFALFQWGNCIYLLTIIQNKIY
jgi:hypothetical protein